MRILGITGDIPRHLYLQKLILQKFGLVGAISMVRDRSAPAPPEFATASDAALYKYHFSLRDQVEHETYGRLEANRLFADIPHIRLEREELNGARACGLVDELAPDIVVITGAGMIRPPLFERLPRMTINVHLGLSPWYRGAAGLFWPFYNLEPACAGVTFHRIDAQADTGPVVHQCTPELRRGDRMHDVAARAVVTAGDALLKLIEKHKMGRRLAEHLQKPNGRYYLTNTFRPEHLRIVYDYLGDKVVDMYLDGALRPKKPKLFQKNLDSSS